MRVGMGMNENSCLGAAGVSDVDNDCDELLEDPASYEAHLLLMVSCAIQAGDVDSGCHPAHCVEGSSGDP